jgi:hypothetical protein
VPVGDFCPRSSIEDEVVMKVVAYLGWYTTECCYAKWLVVGVALSDGE